MSDIQSRSRKMPELDILKFLAIILITNSHLDLLYPTPHLAAGGSLGNTIFFLVSAIGLTFSLSANSKHFGSWFYKRFIRIYPLMWVALIVLIFLGVLRLNASINDFFYYFIFPSPYWFIPAITLFYIPIYFIITRYKQNVIYSITFLLVVSYFISYFLFKDIHKWTIEDDGYFKWLFYFFIMILGVYISKNYSSYNFRGVKDVVILLMLSIFYIVAKWMVSAYPQLMPFQFIIQIITIPWALYLLRLTKAPSLQSFLGRSNFINATVIFISSITLEIYLTQNYFYSLSFIRHLVFPINIILFVGLCVFVSWVFHIAYHAGAEQLKSFYSKLSMKQSPTSFRGSSTDAVPLDQRM